MNPNLMSDWSLMARMLFRSWDVEGRRRWNFDLHKAKLKAKKWRRRSR